MIKRIIILFAAVFMAVGTLFAQSESTGWKENVTGLDSLIKSNPTQAFERVEQLLKGKNKKKQRTDCIHWQELSGCRKSE